ncbi:MAG: peptide chain release factor N(5)-glutamine methyltransferase [Candidatus Paraimprobicoccus trichonymphae]|uniref:peptide chain release factor N(5)-glutamine methyltransferase n=1 Tax=Candidatus Paraimprobicoccus trichonymphae TaxID=3033793 RepID=A0AA48L095_9FIRM|nr:MAG: peptide chain release factor N(5)-glutamine methyltransferase [Candidatus Paraimprobicoccus trichonymphae]
MKNTLLSLYNIAKKFVKNKYEIIYIFEDLFNISYSYLIANKNEILPKEKAKEFLKYVKKRSENFPLQYILKNWEFMGNKLKIGKGVLIPRDDTELLVRKSAHYISKSKCPKILDLCSGSGNISIALSKILNNGPEITSIEKSIRAFKYLKINTENIKNIKIFNSDILKCHENFENSYFDLIISNPPYIPSKDIDNLQKEVKFEPKMALDGGKHGLKFYKCICSKWIKKLKKNGFLSVEVGTNQSLYIRILFENYGLENIETFRDIQDIDRVILAKNTT